MAGDTARCHAMRAHGAISRYAEDEVQVLLGYLRFRIGLRRDGQQIPLMVGERAV
ncbi:hypothetical protein [Kocuria sabuli]|uniref:hypothetical protein n=1 Tax=Kocuria sabuli TaxID=3071448 RepID=UPI0034D6B039